MKRTSTVDQEKRKCRESELMLYIMWKLKKKWNDPEVILLGRSDVWREDDGESSEALQGSRSYHQQWKLSHETAQNRIELPWVHEDNSNGGQRDVPGYDTEGFGNQVEPKHGSPKIRHQPHWCKIYDPEGLLGPVTFRFKLFMKKITELKSGWNDS